MFIACFRAFFFFLCFLLLFLVFLFSFLAIFSFLLCLLVLQFWVRWWSRFSKKAICIAGTRPMIFLFFVCNIMNSPLFVPPPQCCDSWTEDVFVEKVERAAEASLGPECRRKQSHVGSPIQLICESSTTSYLICIDLPHKLVGKISCLCDSE